MTPPTNTTLCPTCGHPRETFASDEGTGGFVPYKPVDSSQPIDIEKEYGKVYDQRDMELIVLIKSIAARVEQSTIKRCAKECKSIQGMIDDGCDFVCSADEAIKRIDRLYAPAALEKGETK